MTEVIAKRVGNKLVTVSIKTVEPHVGFDPQPLAELVWANIQAAIKAGTFNFDVEDSPQATDKPRNKRSNPKNKNTPLQD